LTDATPDQRRANLRFQAQQEDAKRRAESKRLSDNIMNVAKGQFSVKDIKQAQFRNALTTSKSKEEFAKIMKQASFNFPKRDFMKDIDKKKLGFRL